MHAYMNGAVTCRGVSPIQNKYIRDALYINIFGLQFTIRKKM